MSAVSIAKYDDAKRYYLLHRDHKTYEIKITDYIYRVRVADKNSLKAAYFEGERKADWLKNGFYTILCRLEQRDVKWYETAFVVPFNSGVGQTWTNLRGHKIDKGAYMFFIPEVKEEGNIWTRPSYLSCGTIADYIDEVIIAGEPYNDAPAIDISTGAVLYDDLMNPIAKENGQLIDVGGWPLVASDYLPCYYDDDGNYYSYGKIKMTVNSNKQLVDFNGYIIHSVIDELRDGQGLRFEWAADYETCAAAQGQLEWDANLKKWVAKKLDGDDFPDGFLAPANPGEPSYKKPSTGCAGGCAAWDSFLDILIFIGVVLLCIAAAILLYLIIALVVKAARAKK